MEQGLEFLHESRMVHGDIHPGNCVIDFIYNENFWWTTGLRDSSVDRYSFIDFGNALIYPMDTVLEGFKDTQLIPCMYYRDVSEDHIPYDPFLAEVACFVKALAPYVRVRLFFLSC